MDHAGPLIVTRDAELRTELQRLCAAASVVPDLVDDPEVARRPWSTAACVIVGDEIASDVAALGLPRRDDVVLVGREPESEELWRRGVTIRADHVAVLPSAEGWVVDRLTETRDRHCAVAVVIAVVAACGGAGASTLAACLALAAAAEGRPTLLVDADPLSGGVDLVMGCEDVQGLRWPEVSATKGRVSAEALRAALPESHGVSVLSIRPEAPFGGTARSVCPIVAASRRGFHAVIVDVGRRVDAEALAIVAAVDTVTLVSTADVRSAAAAGRLTPALLASGADVRLVVRTTRRAQLTPEELAHSVGVPLAAQLPTRNALHRTIEDGLGPVLTRADRRRVRALLAELRGPSGRRAIR